MTAAEAMASQAAAYCHLIDTRNTFQLLDLLDRLHLSLSALYAAVLALPDIEGPDHEYPRLSDEATDALRHDLERELGAMNLTREIFDPYGGPEEVPVNGSLGDSLADVYRDLYNGLAIAEAGSTENAVSDWRLSFQIHWGHAALDALRAIHAYRFLPGFHDKEWAEAEPG